MEKTEMSFLNIYNKYNENCSVFQKIYENTLETDGFKKNSQKDDNQKDKFDDQLIDEEENKEDNETGNDDTPKEKSSNSLSELADIMYSFGNDCRLMHLYTSGVEFKAYHELLNDLYDLCFSSYDKLAEMAIAHDEIIKNPASIDSKNALEGDKFTADDIIEEVTNRGNQVLDSLNNINKYESFVQSEVDNISAELDKIVNYIIKRSGE